MDVKKGYMKVGDDTVLPFTSYDCIIDKDGNKLTESAESITQNTKAVANIQDYLGVDITKKRNLAHGFTNGTFSTGGIVSEYSLRIASDFIIVENGKTYTITVPIGYYVWEVWGYASVGASGTLIKSTSSVSTYTFTATTNYVRFSVRRSDNGTISPTEANIMLNEGTEPSPYVPYVNTLSGISDAYNGISHEYMDTSNIVDGVYWNQNSYNSSKYKRTGYLIPAGSYIISVSSSCPYTGNCYGMIPFDQDSLSDVVSKGNEIKFTFSEAWGLSIQDNTDNRDFANYVSIRSADFRKIINSNDVLSAMEIEARRDELKTTDVASASAFSKYKTYRRYVAEGNNPTITFPNSRFSLVFEYRYGGNGSPEYLALSVVGMTWQGDGVFTPLLGTTPTTPVISKSGNMVTLQYSGYHHIEVLAED